MSMEKVRHCSHCSAEIRGEDYTVFDNEVLCQSCLEREIVLCEHCGDRCDRIKDHSIHDYSYKPDPIFYGGGKRFSGVEPEIDDGGRYAENDVQSCFKSGCIRC